MADENVPQGISDKQDEIIQYVAKYVVSSCDGARYQEKIRTRTKFNSYFAFLDAKHPYHHYYQYLLDSYRYYLLNSEAVNAGGWGEGGSGGAAGQHPQQQLTEEEYYRYYGAYEAQTGGIGFQGGEGDLTNEEASSYPHGGEAASTATTAAAAAGASGIGAEETSGTASPNAQETAGADEEAEEEEDAYELVMENGEWVSRKRS